MRQNTSSSMEIGEKLIEVAKREAFEHRFFDKASLPDNINEFDKRCIFDWTKDLQQVIVD